LQYVKIRRDQNDGLFKSRTKMVIELVVTTKKFRVPGYKWSRADVVCEPLVVPRCYEPTTIAEVQRTGRYIVFVYFTLNFVRCVIFVPETSRHMQLIHYARLK
jgi:hypothetical protein